MQAFAMTFGGALWAVMMCVPSRKLVGSSRVGICIGVGVAAAGFVVAGIAARYLGLLR